jgi:hypothetical protein
MTEIRLPLDILNEVIDEIQPSIDIYCETYEHHQDHERIIETILRNPERNHRAFHWHVENNSDFIVCQSYKNGLEIIAYNDIAINEKEDLNIIELAEEEFNEIMSQWYVSIHPTLNIRNELIIDYLGVTHNEDSAHIGCVNIPLPSPILW